MPGHQATPNRRAPRGLWAKAGYRLGTLSASLAGSAAMAAIKITTKHKEVTKKLNSASEPPVLVGEGRVTLVGADLGEPPGACRRGAQGPGIRRRLKDPPRYAPSVAIPSPSVGANVENHCRNTGCPSATA
jgi:hypothetical protein